MEYVLSDDFLHIQGVEYDLKGDITFSVDYCRGFQIIAMYRDIDSKEIFYRLKVLYAGEYVEFDVAKADVVDGKKLFQYSKYGLDVTVENFRIVSRIMTSDAESMFFSQGGVIEDVFSVSGVQTVSLENGEESLIYCTNSNPVTGAKYTGFLDFGPFGSESEWRKGVSEEVKDYIPLQFCLSLGMAAVTHSYLKQLGQDIDSFLVELVGLSSTGKSSAAMLIASCEGNPNMDSPFGLVTDLNCTQNYLQKFLKSSRGGIRCLDEISLLDNRKNGSRLVYELCSPKDRGRLSRTAEIKDRSSGCFIGVLTGESGLSTNGNVGINLRLLPFTAMWTKDAAQSERIKELCSHHYGFANSKLGLYLSHYLGEEGKDDFINKYKEYRDLYMSKSKVKTQSERMSTRVGVILLAAYFANQCFGELDLDIDGILEFMIEQEAEYNNERSGFGEVYERLISFVFANFRHFILPDKDNIGRKYGGYKPIEGNAEEYGQIYYLLEPVFVGDKQAKMEVAIRPMAMKKICEKHLGMEDYKAVINFLKGGANGGVCYLNHDTGRDTRRRLLKGKYCDEAVYVVYIVESEETKHVCEGIREQQIEREYQQLLLKEQREQLRKELKTRSMLDID